jgi:hypothetical protein
MQREMVGRLELFRGKPILVTKIGVAYEVVRGTKIIFSEMRTSVLTENIEQEHYGQHVLAIVETE